MRRKPEEQIIGTAQFSRIRRQRLAVVRKIQAEGDMIREVLREPMRDWIDDWLTRGETEDQKDRAARALVDVYMDSWREGELYVLEGDGLRAVKGMADEIPVSADLKEYDFRSRVGILLLDVQPFVETVHFREKGAEDLHFAGLMWSIIPEAEIGAAGRLLLYVLVSDPEGNPILYPPASWDYRLGSPIGENESEDFWTDYAFRFFFSAIQFMQTRPGGSPTGGEKEDPRGGPDGHHAAPVPRQEAPREERRRMGDLVPAPPEGALGASTARSTELAPKVDLAGSDHRRRSFSSA
jgi:hypothetical protein